MAATFSYGDVDLLVPGQEELVWVEHRKTWMDLRAWIEEHFSLADMMPFHLPPPRPSLGTIAWPCPWDHYHRAPQFRINTLFWPTGASRWAFGFFLVAETELEEIRELAYENDTYTALTLTIDDGTGEDDDDLTHTVETDMFMLSAVPIAPQEVVSISGSTEHNNSGLTKWRLPRSTRTLARDTPSDGTEPIYLMPLVDKRYFWWHKASAVSITQGTTTWAQLYSAIGTALGETITAEAVASAYLKPPAEFLNRYEYLPLLLDAVAHSVGQRVVRKLDGTVITQGPAAALLALETQLALDFPRLAGGLLGYDV